MKKEDITQAKIEWQSGAHNNNLIPLGIKYKQAGFNLPEAIADMQAFYDSIDTPDKRDSHHKEVERAFAKAFNTEYIAPKSKVDKADYKPEQQTWRAKQNDDTDLLKEVKIQDVRDDRIQTKTALKTIFKNVQGRISQGDSMADISWMDTDDGFASLKVGAKYVTLATFGDLINEDAQKEEESKGGKKIHYERIDDNVEKIACMLIEYDAPIGQNLKDKDFDAMPEAEKKTTVAQILADTCLALTSAGLKPTTITFSGHKSYHCLFRLKTPVTVAEWETKVNELKSAYKRIGADEKILTLSRSTRMPLATTQLNAHAGTCQRLVYFDPTAEIDFADFCDKVVALADKISPKKEKALFLPVFSKSKTNKDGEEVVNWFYNCEAWEGFLKDIRLTKVYRQNEDEQYLIVSNEQGIFRQIKPTLALDYIVSRIRGVDVKAAAHFREMRASKLAKESMEAYAGIVRKLKMPKDSLASVYAPFKNGLLKIEKDKIYIHEDDFCDFDILIDSQTLKRVFTVTDEKSEFESFIEHACGSEENNPEWKNRKHSIMTLIGYMICRKKEEVNYLNILTEETETENQGGTGKSIIMKSIQYWRKRFFKDMKRLNENTMRFMWSGLKPFTDYAQLDDLPKNANLELFFSPTTDALEYERKGKDEERLDFEDAPKFIIGTNYFPRGEGNSFYRRFRFFELSNHYGADCDPRTEFGHSLFDGWDDLEWNRFDNFFVACVQTYLSDGLCPCNCTNIDQKRINSNMSIELADWIEQCVVCEEMLGEKQFPSEWVKGYTEWYKETYGQYAKTPYNAKYIKSKVKEYCDVKGFDFNNDSKNVAPNASKKNERYVIIDKKNPSKTSTNASTNASTNLLHSSTNLLQNSTNVEAKTENVEEKPVKTEVEDDEFFKDAPDYNKNLLQNVENVEKCRRNVEDSKVVNTRNSNDLQKSSTFSTNNLLYSELFEKNNIIKTRKINEKNVENVESKKTTVKLNNGETVEVVIPEPLEKPWWIFNNVKLSFGAILDNGRIIAEVVYCDGKIPEPITNDDGSKYYQISGSRLKAIDTGIIDETDKEYRPVVFVVLEKETEK